MGRMDGLQAVVDALESDRDRWWTTADVGAIVSGLSSRPENPYEGVTKALRRAVERGLAETERVGRSRMWRRIGSDTVPAHSRAWSDRDDANLRRILGATPHPDKSLIADAAVILRRTEYATRRRALELGIIRRFVHGERICTTCGESYTATTPTQRFCTPQCGQVDKWTRNQHPRGMAGKHHSDETKARLRETSTAAMSDPGVRASRLAPMRAGADEYLRSGRPAAATHSRGRGGRRADLDDRYFRSSWEANYARVLNWQVSAGAIAGWEYEPRTFEFPVKRGTKFYTPDFRVAMLDGSHEWHEVKGWMTAQGKTAIDRFHRHYPDEAARFVLIDADVYRTIGAQFRALVAWE